MKAMPRACADIGRQRLMGKKVVIKIGHHRGLLNVGVTGDVQSTNTGDRNKGVRRSLVVVIEGLDFQTRSDEVIADEAAGDPARVDNGACRWSFASPKTADRRDAANVRGVVRRQVRPPRAPT